LNDSRYTSRRCTALVTKATHRRILTPMTSRAWCMNVIFLSATELRCHTRFPKNASPRSRQVTRQLIWEGDQNTSIPISSCCAGLAILSMAYGIRTLVGHWTRISSVTVRDRSHHGIPDVPASRNSHCSLDLIDRLLRYLPLHSQISRDYFLLLG
jgi:hypothetical protein